MSTTADANFWDRAARKYAASTIADPAGYEHTLIRTRQLLNANDMVLELGCGTGTTALRLAGTVRHYLATDVSGRMIDIAEEKRAAAQVPSLRFLQETAESLAEKNIQYDAVLGFNYLHLVRDFRGTLSHIRDMVRPRGLFISKTPCIADMNPLIQLAIPLMRMIGKAPYVNALHAIDLEREIAVAGFDILAVERHATKGRDTRPFILARKR